MAASLDDDPWVGTSTRAPRRPFPRALLWIGGTVAVFGLALVAVGAWFVFRVASGPELHVVSGAEVDAGTLAYLRERQLLEDGETVLWFYSAGLFDAEEEATFCTDRKVVDYELDEGDAWEAAQFPYAAIDALEFTPAEDDGGFSLLEVHVPGSESRTLFLPVEGEGDRKFEAAVREHWERARK